MTTEWKIFGRITAPQRICIRIVEDFFQSCSTFAVWEVGAKNEGEHIHFIAVTKNQYKTMRSLRDSFSKMVFKHTNDKKNYSVKEFDDSKEEECIMYMCKDCIGHKSFCKDECDVRCPTNVIVNGLCIPREKQIMYHRKYWENRKEMEEKKDTKAFWEKIYYFILERDASMFNRCSSQTPRKIANYVYDYFEENSKFLQNDRFIELVIKTIMIKAYTNHPENRERLKKSMVDNWIQGFSALSYYDYSTEYVDSDSDL